MTNVLIKDRMFIKPLVIVSSRSSRVHKFVTYYLWNETIILSAGKYSKDIFSIVKTNYLTGLVKPLYSSGKR